jgi:hypothetical protein
MESFEAEIESCQVKKGRNRPPRLVKILKRHQHLSILAFSMVHKFLSYYLMHMPELPMLVIALFLLLLSAIK